jgi:hypothetical protein
MVRGLKRRDRGPHFAAMSTPPTKCPICGKPASPGARPFCSTRCAQVDLGRWLNESYRVPVADSDDGQDAGVADETERERTQSG